MLANKDSSSKKKDTKRVNFFTMFYVSLFGFIFLSGTMLGIPSSFQVQKQSMGIQDVYAQEYYQQPQTGYDDKSYGDSGDYYYSNSYDDKRYGKSYDNNYKDYDYGSYDHKKKKNFAEIEKFDNKLFVCENGIVVDDRINCPQICPFNTALEGVYVKDLDVCNIQPGVGLTCPLDTDLPGVVVVNEADCNIFEVCDASSTPLGRALGQDVKVADSALCQLTNIPNLQICEDGPFEGFAVNDPDACDTLDSVQICDVDTDLPGVLTTNPATCNVFEECGLNTPLGNSLGVVKVVDDTICQLKIATCDSDTPLAKALGLTGTIMVTDVQLCQLDVTSHTTTCQAPSDLEGVVVLEDQEDVICNIDIPEQICPRGTDLAGVFIATGANPNDVCNLEKCPDTSDLAGHLIAVGTDPDEACNLLDEAQVSTTSTQSTSSNSPTHLNMKQASQEQKISNQNVEVNKMIEQEKKTPAVLPLFNFKTQ